MAHDARLRSLTYQTEVYVSVEIKKITLGQETGEGIRPNINEQILY
jgi:hypothetical protein